MRKKLTETNKACTNQPCTVIYDPSECRYDGDLPANWK